jgi:hypothetical protein
LKTPWPAALLRPAWLVVTNVVTLLRALPISNRGRGVEVLALRHQLLIPQRRGRPPAVRSIRAAATGATAA